MSKFKVGDKVRCVSTGNRKHLTIGEVYTVRGIADGERHIYIERDGGSALWCYSEKLFELVQPAKEEKVMFKTGDTVRCVSRVNYSYLTVGKIYSVVNADSTSLAVQIDDGSAVWYWWRLFELVKEPKNPTRAEAIEYLRNCHETHVNGASNPIDLSNPIESVYSKIAYELYGVTFVVERTMTVKVTVKE